MNKIFLLVLGFSMSALAAPAADHGGYGAPSSGYGAPSSGYGAPARPSYHAPSHDGEVVHVHHHYNHAPKPSYHAPKPSYHPRPSYHAPSYHRDTHRGSYDDDEYLHLHKEELLRSALLLGAGVVKGVIITGLINNSNNGINIGKK